MANEEHKELAKILKDIHAALRKSATILGSEKAWTAHCANKDLLINYAKCMERLATKHWDGNFENDCSSVTSRITWAVNMCRDYFIDKSYLRYQEKEKEICRKINVTLKPKECFSQTLKLIDVGSCYNPFRVYDVFDVFAIDLCPANSSVLECDFINVPVGSNTAVSDNRRVTQLQQCLFEVVTFCFFLEYLPSPKLRLKACEKAYDILKPGGLLIISTPDSKHVGANSKIMKCWRYTLQCIGFIRIKYEKFKHMHCMAFRKSLNKDVAVRWANIHKEPYMEYTIGIPQDNIIIDEKNSLPRIEANLVDFKELPFCIV